ncbi:efflux RND transporter periplasmic adaptor subunit [Hyphomicrobium sp.]|uniref:efflux RND transporter periplasmic adaptor subunit n=1 Tax=Hyphomicrobium sp. TaxID=82 RepID=UPI002E3114A9|nr:biotin/lipoyl-binding protein [Hyphomicrobium sp.]HEX2841340.1 biotin/lipoyl-binding protein [Hyphomicrobium sp.]
MPALIRVGTVLSLSFVLVTIWSAVIYAQEREHDRRILIKVSVDTVRESQIDSTIVGMGTAAAWREMPISSEAGGLTIFEIYADEGDSVEQGQVLARLNQSLLRVQIDQNEAAVAEAEAAFVRLVAPVVDPTSRQGTVRIGLSSDTELKPGMFVRVEIEAGGAAALTVPLKALVWRAGKAGVFTLSDDGTVLLKEITVGRKTSSVVEVVQGLAAGERIVVEGAGLLNDGEKVRAEVASAKPLTKTP